MKREHPLHLVIGDILGRLDIGDVLLSPECEYRGTRHVQLFCDKPFTSGCRLCKADAIIILNGEVKVIIEIEESQIAPVHLCGKAVATALCSHAKVQSRLFPFGNAVLFVQIINSDKFQKEGSKRQSSKLPQCDNLQKRLPHVLSQLGKRVEYSIHYGNVTKFQEHQDEDELLGEITQFLSSPEPATPVGGDLVDRTPWFVAT